MTTMQPSRRWPTYALIWRWHFYASLVSLPFVLMLAASGSIYLFKPQIEAWLDRPYAHLAIAGPLATASAQADAAVRAVPGSTLQAYRLPAAPDDASQIVVRSAAGDTRVYVHPQTLAILHRIDEDDRAMAIVFRLHGELLAGDVGSYVVELAASWTIVMILTGLFLWRPRGGGGAGIIYPRVRSGGRRFWRDIHAVTGFWVSLAAVFLLLSGLPWAKSWGSYLRAVRSVAEAAPTRPDWTIGHVHHARPAGATARVGTEPLDRLVATVRPLALAPPVLIQPPSRAGAPWAAKSDAANRPLRTDLTLDGATGTLLTRRDFAQRRAIDRVLGYGIAIHEGQAFGIANILLNLATALGLAMLSVSGAILWWRRRPPSVLGAPPAPASTSVALARSFGALLIALGILLPLFGLSLAVVLLADRLILIRWRRARRWLGLAPA